MHPGNGCPAPTREDGSRPGGGILGREGAAPAFNGPETPVWGGGDTSAPGPSLDLTVPTSRSYPSPRLFSNAGWNMCGKSDLRFGEHGSVMWVPPA